jgi:hypothetical protein
VSSAKHRLRSLDRLDTPDVWDRATSFELDPATDHDVAGGRTGGRIVAGVAAAAIFLAAGAFAWRTFQQTSVPTSPSPNSVEGSILWPERTANALSAAQERVDAGDPDLIWRLDPKEVATRFAENVLAWGTPDGSYEIEMPDGSTGNDGGPLEVSLARTAIPCPSPMPGGTEPITCPPPFEGEQLTLAQAATTGGRGIWSVTEVQALDFGIALEPGDDVRNGDVIDGHVAFPATAQSIQGFQAQDGFVAGTQPDCVAHPTLGISAIKSQDVSIDVSIGRDGWNTGGCDATVPGFVWVATGSVTCPPFGGKSCKAPELVSSELSEPSAPLYGLTAVPMLVTVAGAESPTSTLAPPSSPTSITTADATDRISVPAPQPLVAGEGGVWVVAGTTEADNELWRIDPTTNASKVVEGTRGAGWPAVGDGWVWVTICHAGDQEECVSNDLLKIDPTTAAIAATIPLPGFPWMVQTALGSVWVSMAQGLVKVDPISGTTTTLPVKTNLIGSSGAFLWATGSRGGGLAKIDPSDGRVLDTIPFRDPCMMLANETAVWVESCQGASSGSPGDRLERIDPSTDEVDYDIEVASGELAFANGWLWVSRWDGTGGRVLVDQIDPRTGTRTGIGESIEPGPRPWVQMTISPAAIFIAVTDGSFWLTHVDADDVVRVPIPD